jgi:hypothetical protein
MSSNDLATDNLFSKKWEDSWSGLDKYAVSYLDDWTKYMLRQAIQAQYLTFCDWFKSADWDNVWEYEHNFHIQREDTPLEHVMINYILCPRHYGMVLSYLQELGGFQVDFTKVESIVGKDAFSYYVHFEEGKYVFYY